MDGEAPQPSSPGDQATQLVPDAGAGFGEMSLYGLPQPEHGLRTEISNDPNRRRFWLRATGAAVLTTVAFGFAANQLLDDGGNGHAGTVTSGVANPSESQGESAPAPTQDNGPSSIPTLTTSPASPSETGSPTTSETKTAEKEPLPASVLQNIIDQTGFEGLKGHHFEIVDQFNSSAARIVIVSVDGAAPALPVDEIKTDIAIAEAKAASGFTFTSDITTESGTTKPVTFKITPSGNNEGPSRNTRYYLFTKHNPDDLIKPAAQGFPDSVTARSFPQPKTDLINVSIIKDEPGRVLEWGSKANDFYTPVEIEQSSITITAANRADSQYEDAGRELYTNSEGFAIASAREGIPYKDYVAKAPTVQLYTAADTGDHYFAVSEEEYNSFTSS